MSKGSNRRPSLISDNQAEDNWNRIFGKKDHFNHLLEDIDGFNEESNMFGKPMKKGNKGKGKGTKPKC
jgi:hypothetical protein